jgi:hypothetical protein
MNPSLCIKILVSATLLVGCIAILPGNAQSRPSSEINPPQLIPENLPQSNYLGLGVVIEI